MAYNPSKSRRHPQYERDPIETLASSTQRSHLTAYHQATNILHAPSFSMDDRTLAEKVIHAGDTVVIKVGEMIFEERPFIPILKGSRTAASALKEATVLSKKDETSTKYEMRITVDSARFPQLPSKASIEAVLNWLDGTKKSARGDFQPEGMNDMKLVDLIDVERATFLFYPRKEHTAVFFNTVLRRVSEEKLSVDDFRFIYEHMPVENPVVVRTITSIFENVKAKRLYTDEEQVALQAWARSVGGMLWAKVLAIRKSRQEYDFKHRQSQ